MEGLIWGVSMELRKVVDSDLAFELLDWQLGITIIRPALWTGECRVMAQMNMAVFQWMRTSPRRVICRL